MNKIVVILKTEPARVYAAVMALVVLAGSFGLAISGAQSLAIGGAVVALLALFGGEKVRANVTPQAYVEAGHLNEDMSDPEPYVGEHRAEVEDGGDLQ